MLFELVYNIMYRIYKIVCYPVLAVLMILMMISMVPFIIVCAAIFILIPEEVLTSFEKNVLDSEWANKLFLLSLPWEKQQCK